MCRLLTVALVLWFLRWLITTGAERPTVLGLAIQIVKALPRLTGGTTRWTDPVERLLSRSAKTDDAEAPDGGEAAR